VKTISFPVEHTVEKRFHAGVIFAHFKENAKQAKIFPTRAYSIPFQYLPQRVLGTKYTMLNIPQFIASTSQLSMHTPAPSTMQAVIVEFFYENGIVSS
jgi:hypothetical protein